MNNKFYITTAIDYASGNPHIGHAYEKIGADVLARWNRIIGEETFFLTGTDEHGQKIVDCANEEGKTPQEFVDQKVKGFLGLQKSLNLSNDFFIRTTDKDHKSFVQKMLQKSYDNGDIYLDIYEGLYCVGCEKYYTEDELVDGTTCPIHKTKATKLREENYFFKLSKYQDKLLELYEKNPDFISPKKRRLEIINRVKEGLHDISISRNKKTLEWGIEFPFDKNHTTYVWFDALFNYVSAVESKDFWPASTHVIGKDITWFHMVYFPAFLMSVGLDLPQRVHAHGMILDSQGHKISKSLGNVINFNKQIKKYGLDEFRYFLLALGGFGEDLSFSEDAFIEKINNDLNNDLGNLVSRVHAMTSKQDIIAVKKENLKEVDMKLLESLNFYDEFNTLIQDLEFSKALDLLFTKIREVNAYVNEVAPWKEESQERLGTILNILSSSCILFGKYIISFMPTKSKKLLKQFNAKHDSVFRVEFLKKGHKLGEKDNLFEKIKKEKEVKVEKKIEKEGFAVLNLKVGKIISVEQHPEAEKLYVEKIDLGNGDIRQIVSGLKDYYSLDELKGRSVVVAANLKPAKLRGVESQGMVLLAESKDGKLGFLESSAPIGTNLICNSIVADNSEIIKIDKFFKYSLASLGTHVEYEGNKISAQEYELLVENNVEGNVR